MSDAIRNVTIVLNVQPGDMSAIQAAKKELEEMRGITDGIGASTAKITAETESLAKATIEAVKQDREMLTLANDRTTVEEQASAKRTEIRKRELEAETKLETQAVEQIERIRRPLRDNLPTIGTSKSMTGEEASKIAEANAKKNEDIEVQRREKEHQLEMDAIDRKNAEELKKHQEKMKKEEEAEEQARQAAMQKKNQEMAKGIGELLKEIAKREEAEQKAQDKKEEAAEKTLQKIRTSELRNIREREAEEAQAEEEKREKAERTFRQIRMSELKGVREREAEEAEQEERKLENAQKMLQKIRVSELKNIREREAEEDAEREKKVAAADKMFKKIKEAEKKHAREMKEESDEAASAMPKHWRNVGLNAGQAVASAARFVGHMRLLKNVGGESLEEVANRFMTIQSRIETISASTSFFTNIGTMTDGLKTAGEETAKIVRQQQILHQATTLTQTATMGLGTAAASIAPFIAPVQLAFTAIAAVIVAADIAMDFFGESTEDSLKKAQEGAQKFDEQLSKSMEKLEKERQAIAAQNDLLEIQWKMKQQIVGEDNITTGDLQKHQEEQRKKRERELESDHEKQATEIFEGGLTDEQKARRAKVNDEQKKLEEENARYDAELNAIETTEGWTEDTSMMLLWSHKTAKLQANRKRLKTLENQQWMLEDEAYSGTGLGNVDIENGQIVDFDQHMSDLDKIKDKDKRKQAENLLINDLEQSNTLLVQQQEDSERRAADEKRKAEAEKLEVERIKKEQREEEVLAQSYGLEDSQWRTEEVLREMEGITESSTPEEKRQAAERARRLLQGENGQANLMTPELETELSFGAGMNPSSVTTMMQDASTYDQDEQTAYDRAIEEHTAAKLEAQNQAMAMERLATSLKEQLQENKRQIDALIRAIENRDVN